MQLFLTREIQVDCTCTIEIAVFHDIFYIICIICILLYPTEELITSNGPAHIGVLSNATHPNFSFIWNNPVAAGSSRERPRESADRSANPHWHRPLGPALSEPVGNEPNDAGPDGEVDADAEQPERQYEPVRDTFGSVRKVPSASAPRSTAAPALAPVPPKPVEQSQRAAVANTPKQVHRERSEDLEEREAEAEGVRGEEALRAAHSSQPRPPQRVVPHASPILNRQTILTRLRNIGARPDEPERDQSQQEAQSEMELEMERQSDSEKSTASGGVSRHPPAVRKPVLNAQSSSRGVPKSEAPQFHAHTKLREMENELVKEDEENELARTARPLTPVPVRATNRLRLTTAAPVKQATPRPPATKHLSTNTNRDIDEEEWAERDRGTSEGDTIDLSRGVPVRPPAAPPSAPPPIPARAAPSSGSGAGAGTARVQQSARRPPVRAEDIAAAPYEVAEQQEQQLLSAPGSRWWFADRERDERERERERERESDSERPPWFPPPLPVPVPVHVPSSDVRDDRDGRSARQRQRPRIFLEGEPQLLEESPRRGGDARYEFDLRREEDEDEEARRSPVRLQGYLRSPAARDPDFSSKQRTSYEAPETDRERVPEPWRPQWPPPGARKALALKHADTTGRSCIFHTSRCRFLNVVYLENLFWVFPAVCFLFVPCSISADFLNPRTKRIS